LMKLLARVHQSHHVSDCLAPPPPNKFLAEEMIRTELNKKRPERLTFSNFSMVRLSIPPHL
jgi:hypothetical protein